MVVVGGGLAGLFTASELVAAGVDEVVVVEATATAGGVARTIEREGFSLEPAVGAFPQPHPYLGPILDRARIPTREAVGAAIRHVYVDGRLVTVRPSPGALLTPILPFAAKLRALAEPLVRRASSSEEETLGDFCRRRFGMETGALVASLMATGVFAGDPDRLEVDSAFPNLSALERAHGSVLRGALGARRGAAPRPRLVVPVGGMGRLAASLAESLGDRFRAGFPVASLRRAATGWVVEGPETLTADAVVLAVAPAVAGGLLGGGLGGHLQRSRAAPVAVVGLGGPGPDPAAGFGALVGPDEGMASLGILLESSYAPERAPDGTWLVKVLAGGARRPDVVDWDDDTLVDRVVAEVGRVFGVALDPSFVAVARHRPGIPQYDVGHKRWLEGLDGLMPPGLFVTGWGYRGVGITHLATDAARVARAVAG